MTEFNNLLEEIGIIDSKFKPLRDKDRFNIFTILRKSSDEVHLHSRFIYELLNPKGSHNQGDSFLRLWLNVLNIKEFTLEGVSVYKEKHNIDLLIVNKFKQAIIIENKIWASDQSEQLQRYYEKMTNNGYDVLSIFYLSPYGKEPEPQSVGNLPKDLLQIISYSVEVIEWIKECIKISTSNTQLKETLNQYLKLIMKMTGQSNNIEQNLEYFKLMSEGDNAFKANKIIQNWNHVKWHTEWDFWNDLEKVIREKYELTNIEKFSDKRITDTVHNPNKRKLNIWYGLTFKLFPYKSSMLGIRIRRNAFDSGDIGYYLVLIKDDALLEIKKDDNSSELLDKLKDLSEGTASGKNLVNKSFNINFSEFSNQKTLKLVNPNTRKQVISDFIEEIENLIKRVTDILNSNTVIELEK